MPMMWPHTYLIFVNHENSNVGGCDDDKKARRRLQDTVNMPLQVIEDFTLGICLWIYLGHICGYLKLYEVPITGS